MAPRPTRATAASTAAPSRPAKTRKKAAARDTDASDDALEPGAESDGEPSGDEYAEDDDDDDEEEEEAYDSDALDDAPAAGAKRRRGAAPATAAAGARKRRRQAAGDDEGDDTLALKAGQQVVGRVVQAPTTGRVPPGQISRNTLAFLAELKNPRHNNRDWFKLHDPVYRVAEKEWQAFVARFAELLTAADPQVPPLPPTDVIHRIYRDIRFSNDKTPYKQALSASLSRSGRTGLFAGYHIAIRPGDQSIIAAGAWSPGKNELSTIRANILRSPARLRGVIAAPAFVRHFGPAAPHPAGARQNIFGADDELRGAPKGIPRAHKDIDLLKCRSFAAVYRFADAAVLAPGFRHELARVAGLLRPLVHCLNDMMTVGGAGGGDGDDDGDGGDGDGGAVGEDGEEEED